VHNAYEASDPRSTGWRGSGQRQGAPPPDSAGPGRDYGPPPDAAGPGRDYAPPPGPVPSPGSTPDVSDTVSSAYTSPQHPTSQERDDRGPAHAGHQVDAGQAAQADQRPDAKRTAPTAQSVAAFAARAMSTVRRSVPLRTMLFLLPPLVLPALAFDLSLMATLVVAVTLLWLAVAAAVFCVMMLESSQQLTLRFSQDRLERIGMGGAGDDGLQDALLAIGAQLDTLSDQIAILSQNYGPAAPANEHSESLSHRPQEHWPNSPRDEQYDRYGQTAVPDTNWSESRWRR
jgi:hypothetical protein